MPLPIPPLDDRKFQDLVDEAKRSISERVPEWTNHNVSDPGVALIELFAWMSEMVLYRLNQVPDNLYLHFLNMVGIDPYPPSVASTNLTFFLSAELEDTVVVDQGFEVTTIHDATSGRPDPVVFSTTTELAISKPRLVDAKTVTAAGKVTTVWDDVRLAGTRGAPVFDPVTMTVGDGFYLGFRDSLAGMLIRITLEADTKGIGVDPTEPPIAWSVSDGSSPSDDWIATSWRADTTGGLNQAGSIELMVPQGHRPSLVGNEARYWLRVTLQDAGSRKSYIRTPHVRNVRVATLGATVAAEHAEHIGPEELGRSDGKAGQRFTVRRRPVLTRRPDERVVVVHGSQQTPWTEVPDFAGSGPDSLHYVWDGASGEIRFGPLVRQPDGSTRQHGRAPDDGAYITVSGYRTGGGARGNVRAHTLTLARNGLPFVSRIDNFEASEGGVDAESLTEARNRAPTTLRTGQRAVTSADYEQLVQADRSVHRVRCVAARRGHATTRILVVPSVGRRGSYRTVDSLGLDDDLVQRVSDTLESRRVVGTSIEVTTPFYRGVSVAALVLAESGRNHATVQLRAVEALTAFIDPLTGGPDGRGWPYDVDLNAGVVRQELEKIDGVVRVEEALLFAYDLRNGRRLDSATDVVRLPPHTLFLSAAHQVVVR